jgi:hypothetical protein
MERKVISTSSAKGMYSQYSGRSKRNKGRGVEAKRKL